MRHQGLSKMYAVMGHLNLIKLGTLMALTVLKISLVHRLRILSSLPFPLFQYRQSTRRIYDLARVRLMASQQKQRFHVLLINQSKHSAQ